MNNSLINTFLNSSVKFKGPNKYGLYEYICIFGTGYIQYVQGIYFSDGSLGPTNRIKDIEDMKKEIIQKFKQLVNKRFDDLNNFNELG